MSNWSEIGHKSSNVQGLKNLLGQNIEAEVHVNFFGLLQSNTGPIWISLHLYRILVVTCACKARHGNWNSKSSSYFAPRSILAEPKHELDLTNGHYLM